MLRVLTPLFRYSPTRDGYVLRLLGRHVGPVLRPDRRRRQLPFSYERRGVVAR
jgi:hypothetical protein